MEIPFGLNLPEQESVDPYGQSLENVVITQFGAKLRIGSSELIDSSSSSAVDGIYDWKEQSIVIAISAGDVFKMTDSAYLSGSVLLLESGDYLLLEDSSRLFLESSAAITDVSGATSMVSGTRVTWANFGDYLFMANGGNIMELHPSTSQVTHGGNDYTCIYNNIDIEPGVTSGWATYWQDDGAGSSHSAWAGGVRYGSGKADVVEDADCPTTVKFIDVADSYLLAIDESYGFMAFSVVDEPWNWDSDYVSAEGLPDDATCLKVENSDVYVGGSRSVEIFQNDGSTPWVSSSYGSITHGVLAPYSFTYCKDVGFFVWIDNDKRLVSLQGRIPSPLNPTLDTFISSLARVSDAIGDFIALNGVPFLILQFPSDEKTISVNLSNNTWSEWFSTDTNDYKWDGNCVASVPRWDTVLIGDRTDGTIKSIDYRYKTDDGNDINAIIRTPRVVTQGRARVGHLVLYFLKETEAQSAGSATMTVRWRDDGNDWSTARTVTLSDNEKTNYVKKTYRLGSYANHRQYEFDLTNLHPYTLTKVEQI